MLHPVRSGLIMKNLKNPYEKDFLFQSQNKYEKLKIF
jgi:hypothetical protein